MNYTNVPFQKRWAGYVIFAFLLVASAGFAQWTNDPAVNTFVGGTTQNRTMPIVAFNPADGSWYVSSFAEVDSPANFEVWLQRLDSAGFRQWGDDGLRAFPGPFDALISGYSLACDRVGNAVLAFADTRSHTGNTDITVTKLSPSGSFLWDSTGIMLTSGDNATYSPTLAITPNHSILCAWTTTYGSTTKEAVQIQRISASGQVRWTTPLLIAGTDSMCMDPQLIALPDEQFIVAWFHRIDYYKSMYAQRFDSTGATVWSAPVAICANAVIPYFMSMQVAPSDSGFYLSWNDGRDSIGYYNTYVMYLKYDGSTPWPTDGVGVTANRYGIDHQDAALSVFPATHEPVAVWTELQNINLTDYWGVYGQKLSTAGQRMWGDSGLAFVPLRSDTDIVFVKSCPSRDSSVIVVYQNDVFGASGDSIYEGERAMRINLNGSLIWSPGIIPVSTARHRKGFLNICADDRFDQVVAVWYDNRDHDPSNIFGKIFAQEITYDGLPGGVAEQPGRGVALPQAYGLGEAWPNPMPGRTAIAYQLPKQTVVELSLYNIAGQKVRTLVQGTMAAGSHVASWDGRNDRGSSVSQGVYFCRMEAGSFIATRKMVLVR